MTKFNGKELHQGSVSDDGENCVMLICSKDDIRERIDWQKSGLMTTGNLITQERVEWVKDIVDRVFARIEQSDYIMRENHVMQQFWTVIDTLIEDEQE